MNPIIFGAWVSEPGFVALCRTLSEFDWKNRLVAVADDGFLFVDDRVTKIGCYEFFPKLLPWADVEHIKISKHIPIIPTLGGGAVFALGIFLATKALRGNLKISWNQAVSIAAACLIGFILRFGALRHRIVVSSRGVKLTWVSMPFAFRKTIELCRTITDYCVDNGIEHSSLYSTSRES